MHLKRSKKNYKGETCKKCNVEITIGSKSGFCRNCVIRPKVTEQFRQMRREAWLGNQIWKGRKHTKETIDKMTGKPGWAKGRKLSEELKRKLSECKRGSKHNNWKGGITPENKRIRKSLEYKLWRTAVFERDDFTCVWCEERGKILNADHIKPFSLFPELRFEIDNGRTLCSGCHSKTETYKGRIHKYAAHSRPSTDS